ncbi:cytochrome D1 domain-containing protein [Bradyrhizobium centrosematis]|uniref:cytochrome D1 domain-containing protein n=1 Tax=Bradyrhizobium centrosematis TaxID=1300039 RepID=UPI00286D6E27|nr:cytochrome D1 domain-containing protein [Bradyrhizobium centrosematis]MCS3760478.1 protein NirF [Bradyrhizobium centrosematis]MCS3771635.1 protein NirF [Bradyrhizobium centrosematis]
MRVMARWCLALLLLMPILASAAELRGTGNLGLVVERATGSVLIVDATERNSIGRVEGLGDLSHASAVFSPDQRYAYVFGRDGGLTKVDMLTSTIAKRIVQAGNSIGGAISDDGALIAVSNYEPGGVKVFDARTLDPVANIPAIGEGGKASKTVGLVDLPGRRFAWALYDAGEIWIADLTNVETPAITRLTNVGKRPYDGNVTPDGRHYLAGLFGEDGVVHVDTWRAPLKAERILNGYGRGQEALPVYKMPHLEGWGAVGDKLLLPAVGHHELIAVDLRSFAEVGRTATHGQPVFAVARPDGRHVWVNYAHPFNDTVEIVDTETLKVIHRLTPGPAVLHMEFTPRGNEVWVSVRDADRIDVYDATSFVKKTEIPAQKPSGIFFTARATRIGQ